MTRSSVCTALLLTLIGPLPTLAADDPMVARGRYITQIAGCGDCHTTGYIETGVVDESIWLAGDALGFKGPWGTTYAANLRLRLAEMDEATWLRYAREMRPRPPMPWFNVAAMTDDDLRAVYRYVRYLGPTGEKVPPYRAPGEPDDGPVLLFPMPAEPAEKPDEA